MLTKEKNIPKENQSKLSFLKKIENGEDENENPNIEKSKKKESNRLKEINKLLNSMNSVSNEEINPFTVEEIRSLVQCSEQSLNLRQPFATEEEKCLSFKLPEEVITELVSRAKSLMPKYQYRFDQS